MFITQQTEAEKQLQTEQLKNVEGLDLSRPLETEDQKRIRAFKEKLETFEANVEKLVEEKVEAKLKEVETTFNKKLLQLENAWNEKFNSLSTQPKQNEETTK